MLRPDHESSMNRRFSGLTLFSALALAVVLIIAIVMVPILIHHLRWSKAFDTKRGVERAFHMSLLSIEGHYLKTDTSPCDLGVLLRDKYTFKPLIEDRSLQFYFPLATPVQLAKLKQIASGPSTLTPEDAAYVESVANIRYLVPPTGKITEGQLLIYTIKPDDNGLIWLGYSSIGDPSDGTYSGPRIDRVTPTEAATILAALDKSPSSSETNMEPKPSNKNSATHEGDK